MAPVAALLAAALGFGIGDARATARPPEKADYILVLKAERKLLLLRHGRVIRSYPIALGPHAVGPKRAVGDGRTPEGVYLIDGRNAHSQYRLSLHISYPNASDRAQSAVARTDPGGDIFIHGLPARFGRYNPDRFYKDWTRGCISVGNIAIQQIWAAVDDGTPIEIRP